ncbi:unannotated protein [freshwater metagenome]|uniref:Unannotated protein n=1 Tax=freshwater metagenome TaxID=449393 RepID=A0A6J6D3C4_9ZZZZ
MVNLEQRNERRVAGSRLGQDCGHAVETFECFGTLLVSEIWVCLYARTLFAHQKGDDLKLDTVGGTNLLSGLSLSFYLANLARENRNEPGVVERVSAGATASHVGLLCERRSQPLAQDCARSLTINC